MAVGPRRSRTVPQNPVASAVQMNLLFGKTMKWWEKVFQPNIRAIHTAQELVDSLINAGDGLVVFDFFSPGCTGCHALHPKVYALGAFIVSRWAWAKWKENQDKKDSPDEEDGGAPDGSTY